MKKAITFVLAMMLVFAFTSTANAQITKDQYYARSTLEGNELEYYDDLYDAIQNDYGLSGDDYGISDDRAFQIAQYVYNDSPELFGGYIEFTDKEKIDKETNEALSLLSDNMTDYEKVKIIYNWLAENTEYGESEEAGDEGQTIVGALVYGEAVCTGLSSALQYLLYEVDIPNFVVTGGDHAWNIIQIDGQWYNADITKDQEVIKYGVSDLKTFLWGDENFYRSHDWPNELNPPLPECPENYVEPKPKPTPTPTPTLTPTVTPTPEPTVEKTPAPVVANVEPQEPPGDGGNYTGWIIAIAAIGVIVAAGLGMRARKKKRIE